MAEPALSIRDLVFKYRAAESFELRLGGLDLAAGEQVLLAGGSGTGKSTLLQLIAGLMDPVGGSVQIVGRDIHTLYGASRDRYRGTHVGMIFQTFNLLQGFTALENVLAALMFSDLPSGQHRERAESLLRSLDMQRMHARVEELSVGQQQRVAVARAVACKPSLVLADEPTASLDPENAGAAIDLILKTCRENGAALLCTSHDPTMRQKFTRVEMLSELIAGGAL